MNCQEARLYIGADPDTVSSELEQHLQACPSCAEFQREMRALDANIRRALEQSPAAPRTREGRRALAWQGWALAASILVTALAALTVWVIRPTESLAHEIVAHVQDEPGSWGSTHIVPSAALETILRSAGVTMGAPADQIIYARSCWFRGHYVPHLVLQTASGPITVIILRHVQVGARQNFSESGFTGVIVPASQGSVAVLARGPAQIDDVAEQMRLAVHSPADLR